MGRKEWKAFLLVEKECRRERKKRNQDGVSIRLTVCKCGGREGGETGKWPGAPLNDDGQALTA